MALVQMRNSSHAVYLAEFDQAELKRVTYNCGSLCSDKELCYILLTFVTVIGILAMLPLLIFNVLRRHVDVIWKHAMGCCLCPIVLWSALLHTNTTTRRSVQATFVRSVLFLSSFLFKFKPHSKLLTENRI